MNPYTRTVITQRPVARLDNPAAIQAAGGGFEAAAQVFGMASDYVQKEQEAKKKVKLNEAVINYQREIAEVGDAMRSENLATPEGYADRFTERSSEIAKRYKDAMEDEDVKMAFEQSIAAVDLRAYEGNLGWQRTRNVELMAQSLEDARDNLDAMAYRGEDVDSLFRDMEASAVAAEGILNPEKVKDYLDEGKASIVKSRIDGLLSHGQTSEAKRILDSGKYDEYLGGKGLDNLYDEVEKKVKAQKAELEQLQVIDAILGGRSVADPNNKLHRSVVDKGYTESGLAEGFSSMDAQAQQQAVQMVAQTSIIPETMQSTLRGMMVNGDEEQMAFAFSTIAEIEETNPVAIKMGGGFTDEEIDSATRYNAYIRSGATPENAIRSIRESNNPLSNDVREMRKSRLGGKSGELSKITAATVEEALDTPFTLKPSLYADPRVTDAAIADYRNLVEMEYMRTGDSGKAEEYANLAIKNKYGVSNVISSRTAMAYPPENYYSIPQLSPEDNAKWMTEQLTDAVKANGGTGKDMAIVPTPDARGMIDNGMPPRYYVFSDGDIMTGKNNLPLQFTFDKEDGMKRVDAKVKAERQELYEQGQYKRRAYTAIEESGLNPLHKYSAKKIADISAKLGLYKEE